MLHLAHASGQRLLHLLEMLLQTAYLILSPAIGDGLIIGTFGNAQCQILQLSQRYKLSVDEDTAGDEQQQQTDGSDDEDNLQQPVVVAEDVVLRIDDAGAPSEFNLGATRHIGSHEGFIECIVIVY